MTVLFSFTSQQEFALGIKYCDNDMDAVGVLQVTTV